MEGDATWYEGLPQIRRIDNLSTMCHHSVSTPAGPLPQGTPSFGGFFFVSWGVQ